MPGCFVMLTKGELSIEDSISQGLIGSFPVSVFSITYDFIDCLVRGGVNFVMAYLRLHPLAHTSALPCRLQILFSLKFLWLSNLIPDHEPPDLIDILAAKL